MKAGSPGRSLLWINEYIHLCCSAASTSKCSCEIVSLKAHSSLLYETCLHFRGGIVLSLVAFCPSCVWIYICFFPLNVATYIILNNKSLSVHRNLRGTGQMCTRAFALEGLLTLFWKKKKNWQKMCAFWWKRSLSVESPYLTVQSCVFLWEPVKGDTPLLSQAPPGSVANIRRWEAKRK